MPSKCNHVFILLSLSIQCKREKKGKWKRGEEENTYARTVFLHIDKITKYIKSHKIFLLASSTNKDIYFPIFKPANNHTSSPSSTLISFKFHFSPSSPHMSSLSFTPTNLSFINIRSLFPQPPT